MERTQKVLWKGLQKVKVRFGRVKKDKKRNKEEEHSAWQEHLKWMDRADRKSRYGFIQPKTNTSYWRWLAGAQEGVV